MINKDLTEKNEFLTDEEKKYANICANLMYFYLKKSNGIIDVKEVLNNLSGDKGENKKRLERIIGHLNKVILFDKVSLTYSDYLKLDKIVKNQKNYETNSDEETVKTAVHEAIKDKLDGKTIVKEIYVKNRIYNVVVK